MRTARALTLSHSMLARGGVLSPGGCLLWGVYLVGMYLVKGVSVPGGCTWSGGCLLWGRCLLGRCQVLPPC